MPTPTTPLPAVSSPADVRARLDAAMELYRQHQARGRRALLQGLSEDALDETVALLLARSERVDPLAWDHDAWTALHWATRRQYPTVVEALLERGVPVHEQDDRGCAAFDRLMLDHLAHDPEGAEPPDAAEVLLLRALLPAGGRPVVIAHPPRPHHGLSTAQHLAYVNAWRHSALRRGVDAVRLALEVEKVRTPSPTDDPAASSMPLQPKPRARL